MRNRFSLGVRPMEERNQRVECKERVCTLNRRMGGVFYKRHKNNNADL